MKKVITKKVTIDDLAKMIAEGREETNELARMVAKGFAGVDKEIGEVKKDISDIKKDISEVKENLSTTRSEMLAMGDRFTLKYELHDLANRVMALEQKRKVRG